VSLSLAAPGTAVSKTKQAKRTKSKPFFILSSFFLFPPQAFRVAKKGLLRYAL
jgi:hypothetical protein